MSANTSFATTTSTLTQFIAKQKITNGVITSDLSSTEYPISTNAPLNVLRSDILKSTTLSINQANTSQSGYITNTDWNNFDGKLSSIVSGTNISSTGGLNPTVSLSISSGIDMSNQSLTNLSSEDYKTNIDIRQSGISRIYTSGANMSLDPLGNLRILKDVSLNGNRLDMVAGVITGISNENYPTNIDIRQNNVQRIYTTNGSGNMTLDPIGNLRILSDVSLNGNNLDLVNGKLMDVKDQNFRLNVGISQAGVPRIYTDNSANMTLSAPGYLNITTDVSMNGKSIDMSGGSFKKVNYTDMSLNGNTIDMSGGAIIRVGNQNFQTNIDIKQAGVSRIYTSGGTDMTIDPLGNLRILSDLSLNGNTLDMSGGVIRGISNANFPTNIDIRQNNVPCIYTSGVDMTIDPLGNLSILSNLSLNGNTLDMGTGGIITAPAKLTLNPIGNVDVLSDVSLNGNTLDMDSGKIIDVSGIYGISNNNMRIDASSVTFTNNAITHMVIDNCGIILNDISYGDTGTVLTFNTTSNRVSYLPFYYSDVYDISLAVGSGGITHAYSMNVCKLYNTVTIRIPDVSCTPTGSSIAYILMGTPSIDAKYRPSNVITLPVTIGDGPPPNYSYSTGKIKFLTDGSMNIYKSGLESVASWSVALGAEVGIPGQCFTYTV
jgi:hypothetical protein